MRTSTKLVAVSTWLVVACGRPAPLPTIPVAITAWPSPIRPSCYLPDIPVQPKLPTYESTDASVGRLYVRSVDIVELNAWLADIATIVGIQRSCLQKLTDPP